MTTSVVIVNCGPKPIQAQVMDSSINYETVNPRATYVLNPSESKTLLVYDTQYLMIVEDGAWGVIGEGS